MPAFNKFEILSEHLAEKVHDFGADQLEVYLSNALPDAAVDAVKADLAEIATGNGYTGPQDTQNATTRSGGTTSVTGVDILISATGPVGPFQYVVLQNTTPAAAIIDPLVGWWDHGSAITPGAGEDYDIDFGTSMFTVA